MGDDKLFSLFFSNNLPTTQSISNLFISGIKYVYFKDDDYVPTFESPWINLGWNTALSLLGRERIPGVPTASQEEALSTGKARGTPGSCHNSKSPPDVSVHSRGTCFPCTALIFTPRIDWHHGGTWDSDVGKPRGKASRESPMRNTSRERHRSLDPRDGQRDTATAAQEVSVPA